MIVKKQNLKISEELGISMALLTCICGFAQGNGQRKYIVGTGGVPHLS